MLITGNKGEDTISRIDRIYLTPDPLPHGLLWLPDDCPVATTEDSDSLTFVDMAEIRADV